MTLRGLDQLETDAREQLARATLAAAREHSPEWLPDLDAAREEIAARRADRRGTIALALVDRRAMRGGPVRPALAPR